MILRYLLNIIALLEEKPMLFDSLWATGLFPRIQDLEFQLNELEKAQIIWQNDDKKYCLTALGFKFLQYYESKRLITLKPIDLVYNKEVRGYVKLVQPSFPR